MRVLWPPVPTLTASELRILRKIDYYQRVWHDSPSIPQLKTAERLTKRGFIAEFDMHNRGWHLTTLGRDALTRIAEVEG